MLIARYYRYNSRSHPLPFIKASSIGDPRGRAAPPKEKPDLEEAMEESDEGEVVDPAAGDDDEEGEVDLSKDKYVKQPKKAKGKGKARAGDAGGTADKGKNNSKGKSKAKKEDENEEMDETIVDDIKDEPPAKKKGGARRKKT